MPLEIKRKPGQIISIAEGKLLLTLVSVDKESVRVSFKGRQGNRQICIRLEDDLLIMGGDISLNLKKTTTNNQAVFALKQKGDKSSWHGIKWL